MDNSQDQPLPPGVHSWPSYSSNSAQTLSSLPGQVQPGETRPQYHSNYSVPQYHFPLNAPITSDNNTPYNFQQVSGQALTSEAPFNINSTEQKEQNKFSNPFDGGYQNVENATLEALQESGMNFLQKVDEAAVNVSNASTKCSNVQIQLSSACDIDAAAQDAVLREQVCISCICNLFLYYFFYLIVLSILDFCLC